MKSNYRNIKASAHLYANIDSLTAESMKIGSCTGSYRPNYFTGSIREALMYKRVLRRNEIIRNYNSGCVSKPWDTTNLVLWAPLDDGTGTTVNDHPRYHATGTITKLALGIGAVLLRTVISMLQFFARPIQGTLAIILPYAKWHKGAVTPLILKRMITRYMEMKINIRWISCVPLLLYHLI